MRISGKQFIVLRLAVVAGLALIAGQAKAQLVPGTGELVWQAFDNFEDPNWTFVPNFPKSSNNLDEHTRGPLGKSNNGFWYESQLRGEPDVVRRVDTPPGGIAGSKGALLIQTLNSGVPGYTTSGRQQDDLLANVSKKVGGWMPVSWNPSCTVRVFIPPWEHWEQRTGSSFGFRAGVRGNRGEGIEPYWPGFFIQLVDKPGTQEDYAVLVIRGRNNGSDFRGPEIHQPGWWTLGMSFTSDGRVHYYASEGVDDLKPEDHIASGYPYGFRCIRFHTFFFNVVSPNDGRTWSTPWIVDDPQVFFVRTNSGRQPAPRPQSR